ATETVLEFEILWLQIGKGAAELVEFYFGPVQFESCNFRRLDQLSQQLCHILDVRNCRVGISITFAAMRLISIEAPAVVQASRLGFRFFDKLLAQGFELLNLSAVNVEIRNDRTASVVCGHKSSRINLG